jgi:class 3 adenylate cyclase
MMIPDTEQTKRDIVSLVQERDVFKRQFLKIQENYENKIKELSILKELGNSLRSTNFNDRESFLWNQLKIIETYTTLKAITLMLFNEELQVLEMVADSAAEGPLCEPAFAGLEEGPHGRALVDKCPVIVDGNDMGSIKGAGSVLSVPVMHNNSAIGVLNLHRVEHAGFNPNQVRFFSLVADQIATAVILFRIYNQMLQEEKNRLLLSRFFSNRITEKIFGSGGNLRLGGERKNVTILFADLSGFTSMSEHLDQQKVVEILNAYFSLMTPILFKYDGTLDKLMGDGIMAFFGAPISHEDDPVRAVKTAIEMMTALEDFNVQARQRDWPRLEVSMGINTGEVVAGYVGSEDHLNYTVIGDAVNIAQRLQSIAKPNEILISRSVQREIEERMSKLEGLKSLVCLPAQKVKGKEKAVEVFRVEI